MKSLILSICFYSHIFLYQSPSRSFIIHFPSQSLYMLIFVWYFSFHKNFHSTVWKREWIVPPMSIVHSNHANRLWFFTMYIWPTKISTVFPSIPCSYIETILLGSYQFHTNNWLPEYGYSCWSSSRHLGPWGDLGDGS